MENDNQQRTSPTAKLLMVLYQNQVKTIGLSHIIGYTYAQLEESIRFLFQDVIMLDDILGLYLTCDTNVESRVSNDADLFVAINLPGYTLRIYVTATRPMRELFENVMNSNMRFRNFERLLLENLYVRVSTPQSNNFDMGGPIRLWNSSIQRQNIYAAAQSHLGSTPCPPPFSDLEEAPTPEPSRATLHIQEIDLVKEEPRISSSLDSEATISDDND